MIPRLAPDPQRLPLADLTGASSMRPRDEDPALTIHFLDGSTLTFNEIPDDFGHDEGWLGWTSRDSRTYAFPTTVVAMLIIRPDKL